MIGQEQYFLPIEGVKVPEAPGIRSQLFRGEEREGVEEVACSCAGDFTFGMDKERKGEEKKRRERRKRLEGA